MPNAAKTTIKSDSGIPRFVCWVLKTVRKRLVAIPATIIRPIRIKPSTERKVVHLRVTFRFSRASELISSLVSSDKCVHGSYVVSRGVACNALTIYLYRGPYV